MWLFLFDSFDMLVKTCYALHGFWIENSHTLGIFKAGWWVFREILIILHYLKVWVCMFSWEIWAMPCQNQRVGACLGLTYLNYWSMLKLFPFLGAVITCSRLVWVKPFCYSTWSLMTECYEKPHYLLKRPGTEMSLH